MPILPFPQNQAEMAAYQADPNKTFDGTNWTTVAQAAPAPVAPTTPPVAPPAPVAPTAPPAAPVAPTPTPVAPNGLPMAGRLPFPQSQEEMAAYQARQAAGEIKFDGTDWVYVTQPAAPTPAPVAPAPAPAPIPSEPVPTPAPTAPPAAPTTYQIVSGDTLSEIATKNGTTVDALMAANPQITDPNMIYAGQSLNMPVNGDAPILPTEPAVEPEEPVSLIPPGVEPWISPEGKKYYHIIGPKGEAERTTEANLQNRISAGYQAVDEATYKKAQEWGQVGYSQYKAAGYKAGTGLSFADWSAEKWRDFVGLEEQEVPTEPEEPIEDIEDQPIDQIVDNALEEFGVDLAAQDWLNFPEFSFENVISDLLEGMGWSDLQSNINSIQEELDTAVANRDEAVATIRENPWLDQSMQLGRIGRTQDKAQAEITRLQNKLTLATNTAIRVEEKAELYASKALTQYSSEKEYAKDKYDYLLQRAKMDIEAKLAEREERKEEEQWRYTEAAKLLEPVTKRTQIKDIGGKTYLIDLDTGDIMKDYGKTEGLEITDVTDYDLDPESQSLLAQTGLSIPAYAYLTTGTKALTRMTSADRKKFMKEAEQWSIANNVDISTFQSEFDAYNKVVKEKIQISANVGLAGEDIKGSLAMLKNITEEAKYSKLKVVNVAKLWAGKQVNDPLAMEYRFNLEDLRSAVTKFFASQEGRTATTIQDGLNAKELIGNGLAMGSIDGMINTIDKVASRTVDISSQAVDLARKAIWDMFGVDRPQDELTGAGTEEETRMYKGQSYMKAEGGWQLIE